MKSTFRATLYLFCLSYIGTILSFGAPAEASAPPAVSEMRSVPDGNYLVTLEIAGKEQRLNVKVQGNKAICVNSTDPSLKGIQGQFQAHGNGAFVGRFQGGRYRQSQLWIFRADGSAAIRQAPDRGEQESAVPVEGDSLELPKRK